MCRRNQKGQSVINACTVIAGNYAAHAKVLGESLQRHNPDSSLQVLLIDDHPGAETLIATTTANIKVIRPSDLDNPHFLEMAAAYDVLELSTAMKPWLLRHVLTTGANHAIYLDPDIKVYGGLREIASLSADKNVVLTPHNLRPFPDDGFLPTETDIMAAGVFNLGFIAVGSQADEFLDWWSSHLLRDCIAEPAKSIFVDQRWMDLAPSLFRAHILRDPEYNVAYWNLHERELSYTTRYEVDGRPLRFFHFSGFDSLMPHLLSKHQSIQPRILLSENPVIARICAEYASDLQDAGNESVANLDYGFARANNGLRLDRTMRRTYRDSLKLADRGEIDPPPNPLQAPEHFIDWLNQPAGSHVRFDVTRYLLGMWELRSDLQRAFPDLSGPDAARYLRWAEGVAERDASIDRRLIPEAGPSDSHLEWPQYPHASTLRRGVNVAGYLGAELGIGEIGRLVTTAIESTGRECATLDRKTATHRHKAGFQAREACVGEFDTNLICVNADRLPEFAHAVGPHFFDGRHTIGFWWWEVSDLPHNYRQAFELVDEIWCGSDHVRDAIARISPKPVHKVVLPLAELANYPRRERLVDEPGNRDFTFLFSFDFYSVVARKNPEGLIDAYVSAFAESDGAKLIIKTINGDKHMSEHERLRRYGGGRPDIEFLDGYLATEANRDLIAAADCYVSLHRAEGLGLTMAEAIAVGTPVIATAYSGNLEYMRPSSSWLVPYELCEIPAGCEPYPPGALWAEPDIAAASAFMRQVFDDPELATKKAEVARQEILRDFSVKRAAKSIDRHLESIGQSTTGRAPARSASDAIEGALRARSYLDRGPDADATSRLGPPGRFARRAILRSLHSYSLYQGEVDRGLIDAIAELERRLRDSEAKSDTLLDELSELRSDLRAHQSRASAETRAMEQTSASIESALRGLPPMADPARFVLSDDDGNRYVGFGPDDSVPYAGPENASRQIEELLRGPESVRREKLTGLVDLLSSHAPVLDAGCGRGEMLGLLAEHGIEATGVDIDYSMIRAAMAKGVKCEQADVIDYLHGLADESLGAVFSAGLVQYLGIEDLKSLIDLSRSKLLPGGVFVAETVNPHSSAAMRSFWSDPARRTPLYPEIAIALFQVYGFSQARIAFPASTGSLDDDRSTGHSYIVIATKAP